MRFKQREDKHQKITQCTFKTAQNLGKTKQKGQRGKR